MKETLLLMENVIVLSTEKSVNLEICNNIFSNTIENTNTSYSMGIVQQSAELSNIFKNNLHYVGGPKHIHILIGLLMRLQVHTLIFPDGKVPDSSLVADATEGVALVTLHLPIVQQTMFHYYPPHRLLVQGYHFQ